MIPYIVAGLIGALAVHRTLPNTKVTKLKCIGPKSGLQYDVEDFIGTSFIVVRYQDTKVTLQKNVDSPGYKIITVMDESNPAIVRRIQADFSND